MIEQNVTSQRASLETVQREPLETSQRASLETVQREPLETSQREPLQQEKKACIPLLLHACCGPCSLEPLKHLREEGFDPIICWTNPNIAPVSEHDLRLRTLQAWARDVAHCDVIVAGDDRRRWERVVAPAAFQREQRCRACYALRLEESCRIAAEQGIHYISTTLAVSPYQLFDTCRDVLYALAARYGLEPVWRDFRPFYPEATRTSRELKMYRQNYCGCRFSAAEAALDRQRVRDERRKARTKHAA